MKQFPKINTQIDNIILKFMKISLIKLKKGSI